MQPEPPASDVRFSHPDAFGARPIQGLPPDPVNPDAPQPPQRYYRPRPTRRGGWFKKLIIILLLLALAGLVAYAVNIIGIVAKISTKAWVFAPMSADASGRTNILVLGIGDPGHAGENLTDTVMLISFDKQSGRMAQVSIPRDLRVNIPGYGYSKINAANADGGVPLAEQTVSNTLAVPIDYYIKTNFSGLKDLVDAVGGIDVNVKTRLYDPEYPCDDNQYKVCGLDIEPGLQHMDGTRALQYVRCRKGTCGNDFGRAARQQEVIGLLRPKVTDWHLLLNPVALTKLATAAQKGIETDMGLIQLLEFGQHWQSSSAKNPIHLVLSTAPGGYLRDDPYGSSDLLPVGGSFTAIQQAVGSVFSSP